MTASAPTHENTPDDTIFARLLAWYDVHARTFPWRSAPGMLAPDPYRVWLSEVMLQQTTTAAVIPYFQKFTRRWPDVNALAAARQDEVMAAWAGLGYYSRARNLYACAVAVAKMGSFPDSEAELRQLPGLGAYTSAAIAAIAFDRRAVVVDANVERVVARLFAIDEPLPAARKAIRSAADTITPDARAGDFAQAMMDLGATICTTREPRCMLCPLSTDCEGRRTGDPARLPVKPPKKGKPVIQGTAFWMERDGKVWLVTRGDTGVLGGMRALPDDGWTARQNGTGEPPLTGDWQDAGLVRHAFTHAALELSVKTLPVSKTPSGEGQWWPIGRLDDAGLPTLFTKAMRVVLANR